MLFKCLPPGAPIPGPVSRARPCARQMVHCRHPLPCADPEGGRDGRRQRCRHSPPARDLCQRAHPRGQPRAGRAQPHPVHLDRKAARRHGPDGDRHPGDHAVAEPDLLRRRPRSRHRHRARHQRQHRRHRRRAIPIASCGSAPCRSRRPNSPSPNSNGCTNRSGFAASRSPPTSPAPICPTTASARSSPARGTRPDGVHAPDRLHRGAALRRSLLYQRDRQPAGHDGRGASPDLRRRAGRPPPSEAGAVAWRRLPAGLFRPHRPRRLGPAGLLRADPRDADDLSEAAVFRHAGLYASAAGISGAANTAPTTC